jgi:hypothetical protein
MKTGHSWVGMELDNGSECLARFPIVARGFALPHSYQANFGDNILPKSNVGFSPKVKLLDHIAYHTHPYSATLKNDLPVHLFPHKSLWCDDY